MLSPVPHLGLAKIDWEKAGPAYADRILALENGRIVEVGPNLAQGSAQVAYAQAYPTSDRRAEELPIWLHRYNWHRPHGGIQSKTPISRLGLTRDNLLRLHT